MLSVLSGPALRSSAMWLQDSGGTTSANDAHWTMIFVGVIAGCFLFLALIVLVLAIGSYVAAKKAAAFAGEAMRKAAPAIASANSLFQDVEPHVRKITTNVSSITETVKSKIDQFDTTLTDVNDRTKAQVARVDGMVNEALTTTADIAGTIQRGIRMPIREVAGIFAGFRAAVEVLAGRDKESSVASATRAASSVTPISPRPTAPPAVAAAMRTQEMSKEL